MKHFDYLHGVNWL